MKYLRWLLVSLVVFTLGCLMLPTTGLAADRSAQGFWADGGDGLMGDPDTGGGGYVGDKDMYCFRLMPARNTDGGASNRWHFWTLRAWFSHSVGSRVLQSDRQ